MLPMGMIPWKLVAIVVLLTAAVAGALHVVRSYNKALTDAQEARAQVAQLEQQLADEQEKVRQLNTNLAELKTFYAARQLRQAQSADRRSRVLQRKEVTDATGSIAGDDPTLLDLNRLFDNAAGGGSDTDATDGADLSGGAAGEVHPGG